MNKKLTRWIAGRYKPEIAGPYERKYPSGTIVYCKWTGSQWMWGSLTLKKAAQENRKSSYQSQVPWRGLAEDPSLSQ